MPIVQPQVFRYDDLANLDTSGLAGYGQLLRALVEQYRRRGPQLFQSPTGQTTRISPAERVVGTPNVQLADLIQQQVVPSTPGTSLTPTRLSFLGPQQIPQQQLQQMANVAALQQAQAGISKAPFEKRKLEAETRKEEAFAEVLKSGGAIVTLDLFGNQVPPGTPNSRQFRVTPSGLSPLTPTPEQQEESATRRQLLKKAADQKLQLEQSINLFNKMFNEAESALPKIQQPFPGTLRPQQLLRFSARETGFAEKARGTIQSFKARATPVLKSLGEVGVLTNQDIARILSGGLPSDLDTEESRQAKRIGILSDLQSKLDAVNQTLSGQAPRQQVSNQPTLMRDAQGNQAYVYPDGRVEEIP